MFLIKESLILLGSQIHMILQYFACHRLKIDYVDIFGISQSSASILSIDDVVEPEIGEAQNKAQ